MEKVIKIILTEFSHFFLHLIYLFLQMHIGKKKQFLQRSLWFSFLLSYLFIRFHLDCFFEKHRPKTFAQIDHFEDIRYEDQQIIRQHIDSTTSILIPETSKGKKGKKRAASGEEQSVTKNFAINDFGVEYAKSSRATCVGCGSLIMKDQVRIKKIDYTTEVGMKFGGQPFWHHVKCFAGIRSDYNFYLGGADLPGYSDLDANDKKTLKQEIQWV